MTVPTYPNPKMSPDAQAILDALNKINKTLGSIQIELQMIRQFGTSTPMPASPPGERRL